MEKYHVDKYYFENFVTNVYFKHAHSAGTWIRRKHYHNNQMDFNIMHNNRWK